MELLRWFLLAAGTCSLLTLIVGLVRPWPVLWWRYKQNRKGVLKLYGPAMVFAFTGYLLIETLWS